MMEIWEILILIMLPLPLFPLIKFIRAREAELKELDKLVRISKELDKLVKMKERDNDN